ncbi:MAG: cob(I)yrinic acid a,c-diamide adenosyltransferase [Candidatus Omnitrophica bacterium]|nr:cob(I)yrinic acid a,c-diamide adenosyltransferase [Candidatus Omnitrophota bacterium]
MSVRSGKGDKGFTNLPFRRCISKDSLEMRALGDLDELNSYLGLIKCKIRVKKERSIIDKVQHLILVVSSEIVVPLEKKKKLGTLLKKDDAVWAKKTVLQLEKTIKIDSCFHVPGGNTLSAYLDITRSIARRAERNIVSLVQNNKDTNEDILLFLNCVSDILFIMARKRGCKRKVR